MFGHGGGMVWYLEHLSSGEITHVAGVDVGDKKVRRLSADFVDCKMISGVRGKELAAQNGKKSG